MSTTIRTTEPAPYLPPARDAMLAEGLRCIAEGRVMPEALRSTPIAPPAVATVAEGIARILAGPVVRPVA